jgi:AcrR family transcriptional regulator
MLRHPRQPHGPTTNSEPHNTKTRILKAALSEFSKYGLAGARVDRIARKARVNKAMIYYHFASKKTLYRDTIKQRFSDILTDAGQAITTSDRFEDMLCALADSYATAFTKKPEFARIVLRELADEESKIVELLANAVTESGLRDQIVKSFQEGIRHGRFRPIDIRQAFVSFVLMNIGYFLLAPMVDNVWSITDHAEFVAERKNASIDLFLHGVKIR